MSDSVKSNIREFTKHSIDWLAAFASADRKQRNAFFYRFKDEMQILQYLEILQGKVTKDESPMLKIDSLFHVAKQHEDMVMIDLETVWNKGITLGSRARHAFTTTEHGFEMHWAVAPANQYVINGVLQVTGKR